jgi:hypothetical protein
MRVAGPKTRLPWLSWPGRLRLPTHYNKRKREKMKKILAALLLTPCMALAQFETGNSLLSKLKNNTPTVGVVDQMFAAGYIIGIADSFYGVTFCPPNTVNVGQLNDVVKNFLEANPEVRHRPADIIVEVVLRNTFPCKTDKKNKGKAA